MSQWIGFSRCLTIDSNKTYYVGLAGDNGISFYVDGTLKVQILTCLNQSPFLKWRIYPIQLSQGQHTIQLEGYNCGYLASFGVEIYDNTWQQIAGATTLDNLNVIFSSRDMLGGQLDVGHYSCPVNFSLNTCDVPFTCRSYIPSNLNKLINPYYAGILGNWRAQSQFVYQTSRESLIGDPTKLGSTNVRKSGAYSVFSPFWVYNTSLALWQSNPGSDTKWIEANRVTYFNEKGTEIENRDALNRYSSALFGYLQSLPVAVASNSQYREIAYDGFEDYNFAIGCALNDTCNQGQFNFKKVLGSAASLNTSYAHSGKTSLALNGTVAINKTVYLGSNFSLYTLSNGQYYFGANEVAKGFSPVPGKKYVLSLWVKDGSPRDATTTFQASVNGTSLISNLSKWPIVEGWKRIEVPFVLPSSATNFSLQLTSSGQVYIDDIRIHPFDGQMKSFAYDASSQRLMAELDENNFATFYEYDDEGILIRVKKETDRGIMTIKETRSSYKKN